MVWLFLGVILLVLLLLAARGLADADPRWVLCVGRWLLILALLLVAGALVVTGRLHFAWLVVATILSWFWRFQMAHRFWCTLRGMGQAKPDPPQRAGRMDRNEAYQVLGLDPGASETDIRAAYRALMKRLHPDHGGSAWMAARVNEARDVLSRR